MRAQPDYPLVTAAIEAFADWWTRRHNRTHGLDSASRLDRDAIAKDIGVRAADLRTIDASALRSPR
jgi:hypothetical protein